MAATVDPMELVHTAVTNAPGVAALVGARVYPYRVPVDPVWPLVTFFIVSGVHNVTLDGLDGAGNYQVQVDSWSATNGKECRDIGDAVRAALDAAPLLNIGAVDERQAYEQTGKRYRTSQDFSFWIDGN